MLLKDGTSLADYVSAARADCDADPLPAELVEALNKLQAQYGTPFGQGGNWLGSKLGSEA
jgi:hypothetical protein